MLPNCAVKEEAKFFFYTRERKTKKITKKLGVQFWCAIFLLSFIIFS